MRKLFTALPALVLIALVTNTGSLDAQTETGFSVEARGAWSIPLGDFGDASAGKFGFGGTVYVPFTETFSAFGGYNFMSYDCDGNPCAEGDEVNSKGFEVGVRANFPLEGSFVIPWFQGGAIFNELDSADPLISTGESLDGDLQLGWGFGFGADFGLNEYLYVSPGIRWVSFSPEFPPEQTFNNDDRSVGYVTFDVGLRLDFQALRNRN